MVIVIVVMPTIKSFKDLEVWQKAMDMVDIIYDLTNDFPDSERFGLTNQIRRAAVSVPSNIAEGSGRNNTKELIQFLFIARGSLCELYTQIEIGRRRRFGKPQAYDDTFEHIKRVGQMLGKLTKSLRS